MQHFCSVSSLGLRVVYTSTSQNERDMHGLAPYFVPKTEEYAGATIRRQRHVDFLLGLQGDDLRALHAQRKHCDECHLLKSSGRKSEASYSQKRCGLLTTGVCFLQDNARPHTATATLSTKEELRFECILHAPHSTDFAPSDIYVFVALKDALIGTQFQ